MIEFVRHLNEPYKRSDFVIGGFCMVIDGIVDIISFGYVRTGLQIWWIGKNFDRMFSYQMLSYHMMEDCLDDI